MIDQCTDLPGSELQQLPKVRRFQLFSRKQIWWPTKWGWLLLMLTILAAGISVWFGGEGFLALTDRVEADVLVVEGWIGGAALQAAAEEFGKGGYRYVVTTGGYTPKAWGGRRHSYAEIAARELKKAGIPGSVLILAEPPAVDEQRTFASAVAIRRVLERRGIKPHGLNVFTRGMHARRSRLVYKKAHQVPVGVIGWTPEHHRSIAWWHSSERAKDLLTEGCAYGFEAALNSGRLSNRINLSEERREAPGFSEKPAS